MAYLIYELTTEVHKRKTKINKQAKLFKIRIQMTELKEAMQY